MSSSCRSRVLAGPAVLLALLLAPPAALARNLMTADGPGGTYELLRGAYTTELPDCGHMVPHITEVFDEELKKNVFVFHAHVGQDDDRCGGTDRQRTEIRARAADIVAQNNETVYYRWKFKLDAGFQASPNFTHIFQIKSDLGAPIMTLTPRGNSFGTTGRINNSGTAELARFRGTWVVVNLKVLYANAGRTETTIRRLSDGVMLFSQAGDADMWDDNASGHDSKFGIYRSLNNRDQLRDEQVRFADFCASKVSAAECEDDGAPPPPPPSDAGAPVPPDAGGSDAGGAGGAGGSGGSGGAGGAGPAGSGGTGGSAGAGGTGGSAGAGGSGGTGGSAPPPPAPPSPGTPGPASGGCDCSLSSAPTSGSGPATASILLGGALLLARRRRRRR